jgi:hypothetical protein
MRTGTIDKDYISGIFESYMPQELGDPDEKSIYNESRIAGPGFVAKKQLFMRLFGDKPGKKAGLPGTRPVQEKSASAR